jgi:hypothetical protein
MVQRRRGGETLGELGACYGITRERVRQIVDRIDPSANKEAKRGRRAAREAKLREKAQRIAEASYEANPRTLYKPGSQYATVWTNEAMLAALRNLASELGETPSSKRINAQPSERIPTAAMFYRRFGSLRKAQELAGLVPNERLRRTYVKTYPKEDVVRFMVEYILWAEAAGVASSARNYDTWYGMDKASRPSIGTIRNRMNWNDAKRLAIESIQVSN